MIIIIKDYNYIVKPTCLDERIKDNKAERLFKL